MCNAIYWFLSLPKAAFIIPGNHYLPVWGGKGCHHDPRTTTFCAIFFSWQANTQNLKHTNNNCCHCLFSSEPPKAIALIAVRGNTKNGTTSSGTTSVEVDGKHTKLIPDPLEALWDMLTFVIPGS